MNGFTCKIVEASETLTPEEKLASMDTQTMSKISDLKNTDTVLQIRGYVKLEIHNPNPKEDGNMDYTSTVYHTDSGLYHTGSESFMNSYKMLADNAETLGIDPTSIRVQVVSKKSSNNQGEMLLAKYVK